MENGNLTVLLPATEPTCVLAVHIREGVKYFVSANFILREVSTG